MNILLGRLKTGDYRNVTDKEIEELNLLIKQKQKAKTKAIPRSNRS
jgi:hypothetical protein